MKTARFPAIDSQWVLEEPAGWVRLVVVGIERHPGQEPRVYAHRAGKRRTLRRFHLGYFQKWAKQVRA